MISTSKIERARSISRPRILADAALEILGREIERGRTKMLVEIIWGAGVMGWG
jgi:hypothetical protein